MAWLKRAVAKLHLWLGLGSGLVVFVVGVTGATYAFEEELRHGLHPERHFVSVPANPVRASLDRLRAVADLAIAGEAPTDGVRIYRDPARSVVFSYQKSDPGRFGYGASRLVDKKVYLDPYTAEVIAVVDERWELLELVYWTHTSLLLGYELGHQVVGWSVLIFVFMLGSGLVLWWPRSPSVAKKRLWFRWRPATGWKRKNYDLHSILGFWVLGVAFVLALTGLVWSFDAVDRALQWIANGGREHTGPAYVSTPAPRRADSPLDRILADVSAEHPDAESYTIHIGSTVEAEGVYFATAILSTNGIWKNSYGVFDAYSLERLGGRRHEDKSNGELLYDMNYDVHTGRIAGLPGKVLVFLASLVVASLPISGALLWWGRHRRGRSRTGTLIGIV